jgi:hypothetical protein
VGDTHQQQQHEQARGDLEQQRSRNTDAEFGDHQQVQGRFLDACGVFDVLPAVGQPVAETGQDPQRQQPIKQHCFECARRSVHGSRRFAQAVRGFGGSGLGGTPGTACFSF